MFSFSVFRPGQKTSLENLIDSQLEQYKMLGCLDVRKPPRAKRLTKEEKRMLARDRRIDEAVERMIQEAFDEPEEIFYHYVKPPRVESSFLSMKTGTDYNVEEEADQFLAEGRRGENKETDPRDWLTKEQLALRIQKEIYNSHGLPDGRLMSGIYRRAFNPNAGSRPNKASRHSEE